MEGRTSLMATVSRYFLLKATRNLSHLNVFWGAGEGNGLVNDSF